MELDELVEHFTLLPDEVARLRNKSGPTRLGFALLLKFFTHRGRFPAGRGELADEVVEFVAKQVGVAGAELGFYDWSGRQIKAHRSEIRGSLGFRECSVADAEKLTAWLAEHVAQAERRPDQVRVELLAHCWEERIEPPGRTRVERILASALYQGEETLFAGVTSRLPPEVATRLVTLIVAGGDGEDDEGRAGIGGGPSVLALIKTDPGNVSLESMLTEIDKLLAVRAVGVPAEVFADVAPRVLAGWRAQAAVESPSHLRAHPNPAKTLTLLAALLHIREREITDTLVELLIATVHRINARAEKKVTAELINAFKKVTDKENILFSIAEASLAAPEEKVRRVVYPAIAAGRRRCGSWYTSTGRRGRCTGQRWRPHCAPPTPTTIGAG